MILALLQCIVITALFHILADVYHVEADVLIEFGYRYRGLVVIAVFLFFSFGSYMMALRRFVWVRRTVLLFALLMKSGLRVLRIGRFAGPNL